MSLLKIAIKSLWKIIWSKAEKLFVNSKSLSFGANVESNNFVTKDTKIVLDFGLISNFIRLREDTLSQGFQVLKKSYWFVGLWEIRNVCFCLVLLGFVRCAKKIANFWGGWKIFMYFILAVSKWIVNYNAIIAEQTEEVWGLELYSGTAMCGSQG